MTKIIFNIINTIFIILYIYPGSILGFLIYGEFYKQPTITPDFLLISSNHVYAFFALSLIGLIAYYKSKKIFSFGRGDSAKKFIKTLNNKNFWKTDKQKYFSQI